MTDIYEISIGICEICRNIFHYSPVIQQKLPRGRCYEDVTGRFNRRDPGQEEGSIPYLQGEDAEEAPGHHIEDDANDDPNRLTTPAVQALDQEDD